MIRAPGFEAVHGRPRIIGHRGVRRATPAENTLAAFARAVDEGAEAIELDVRVCRSGELVVMHDPTLLAMTDQRDGRAIADLSWDELRRVELAGGAHAPRLVDVLAWARARRLAVNVEMKRDVPSRTEVTRATARALRRWDPAHPVLVSSFDPVMLAGLGQLAPEVPRALLISSTEWRRTALTLAPRFSLAAVHLDHPLATPARVAAFRARGVLVNVWTVNDAAQAQALAALGVSGIITDDPATLRAALAQDEGPRG